MPSSPPLKLPTLFASRGLHPTPLTRFPVLSVIRYIPSCHPATPAQPRTEHGASQQARRFGGGGGCLQMNHVMNNFDPGSKIPLLSCARPGQWCGGGGGQNWCSTPRVQARAVHVKHGNLDQGCQMFVRYMILQCKCMVYLLLPCQAS